MSSHGGTRAGPSGFSIGIDAAAKNRMVQEIIQEAVDATEREVTKERKLDQMDLIGHPLNFSIDRPKEEELFNDYMKAVREKPKDEHWDELETLYKSQSDYVHVFPKLRFMLESHYTKWKENRELALIRKMCHAKWLQTQELTLIEDYNWRATQELKDSVKLEGWGVQFFPTPF